MGEGNGTPLQYSCLENPRDGGAWWAAVSGVTQSRTLLKRLSSSSSLLSIPQTFCFSVNKSCVFLTCSPSFPLRFKMKLGGSLPGLSVSCKDRLLTSLSVHQRYQELKKRVAWWEWNPRVCVFSHVRLFVTLWTVACQAPLSMGLSRQEYWSGLPFPPPGGLPSPGTKQASPMSTALQMDSPAEPSGKPRKEMIICKRLLTSSRACRWRI